MLIKFVLFLVQIVEVLLQFSQNFIRCLLSPLVCPEHAAPKCFQIRLGPLLLSEHLHHNIDPWLNIPEADELFHIVARHLGVFWMRFDLSQRATNPSCANAIVNVPLGCRSADVGQHPHALGFSSQLDLELVTTQQPGCIRFQAMVSS